MTEEHDDHVPVDESRSALADRPVRVHIEGREPDMRRLQRLFRDDDTGVEKRDRDGQWLLFSPALTKLWEPGAQSELHRAAEAMVKRLNGVARAEEPEHRPVRNKRRYEGPGNDTVVGVIGTAVEIDVVALALGSQGGVPLQPQGPGYLELAGQVDELDQVLTLLGDAEELTTYDMWKLHELVARGHGGANRGVACQKLIDDGWLTNAEWHSFRAVVNDQHVSGAEARHATHAPTNATPMSLYEARGLVSRLVRYWRTELERHGRS